MTRDALARRLTKYAADAARACPSLRNKTITPHTLRHTAAMRLLHAGIDTSVIALWLGHAEIQTTQIYLHADLTIKEEALAKAAPIDSNPAATGRATSSWRSLRPSDGTGSPRGTVTPSLPAKLLPAQRARYPDRNSTNSCATNSLAASVQITPAFR